MVRGGGWVAALVLASSLAAGCGGGGGGGGGRPGGSGGPGGTGGPPAPPAPARLSIVSGDNQVATAASVLAPFVVDVQDASGAPLAGVAVAFSVSGLGTVTPSVATTDALGDASATLTLSSAAGPVTVTASVAGAGAVTFRAQAAPGPAAALRFLDQPALVPALQAMSAVSVGVVDAFGNTVATPVVVTLALGTNPTGAALGGPALGVTTTGGVASIASLTVDRVGQGYTLLATSPGLSTASSDPFDVGAIPARDGLGHIDDGRMNFARSAPDDAVNPSGFDSPRGLAVDRSTHRLFVADSVNARVLVFPLTVDDALSGRAATAVLGQPDFTTNAPGLAADRLRSPRGLAVDEAGQRLFVADELNHRVLVFSTANLASGQAATHVIGQLGFGNDFPGTNQFQLRSPTGLAYQPSTRRLFVADSGNQRLLVFDVTTLTNLPPAEHVLGQLNFTSSLTLGAGHAGSVRLPQDLCVDDATNRLFVADTQDNRVLVFDVATIVDGEAATGVLGQPDFDDTFSNTTRSGLDVPNSVTYDGATGRLFVGDYQNRRVMVFDAAIVTDGEDATHVIGKTDFVTWPPAPDPRLAIYGGGGLVHAGGALLVGMGFAAGPHRILAFATTALQSGQPAVDGLGHMDGTTMNFTRSAANDSPSGSTLDRPMAVVADPTGRRLFVCDSQNHRVLVFETAVSGDLAGTPRAAAVVLGQPDLSTTFGGTSFVDATQLSSPEALAYDPARGRLFVADTTASRVLVFDVTAVTNDEAAVSVLGQSTFTASGTSLTQGGLVLPSGLAYDAAGERLFVADRGANRVVVFDVASITDGEDALNVLGQTTFTANAPATTQGGLSAPTDVCFDAASQRLFVADTGNHRVVVFHVGAITDGEAAVNVLGTTSYVSNTAGVGTARLDGPTGLALDAPRGRLYVADSGNHRVLRWNLGGLTNGMPAAAVLGRPDLASGGAGLGTTGMSSPRGLTVIPGRATVLVTELDNHRLTLFEP